MSNSMTVEQLEEQIAQLPVHEQLKLIARISDQLSMVSLTKEKASPRKADELLALCDAAAEMWEGEFDATQEICQMRQERDEQIWLNRS